MPKPNLPDDIIWHAEAIAAYMRLPVRRVRNLYDPKRDNPMPIHRPEPDSRLIHAFKSAWARANRHDGSRDDDVPPADALKRMRPPHRGARTRARRHRNNRSRK
jgi:hypothetical protein